MKPAELADNVANLPIGIVNLSGQWPKGSPTSMGTDEPNLMRSEFRAEVRSYPLSVSVSLYEALS